MPLYKLIKKLNLSVFIFFSCYKKTYDVILVTHYLKQVDISTFDCPEYEIDTIVIRITDLY